MNELQRVQNSAPRLIMKSHKCDNVQPLLYNLHQSAQGLTTRFQPCASALTNSSPVYITKLLSIYTPSRHLCSSSDTCTPHICFIKTKSFGQRAFSFTGPTQRNLLPYGLRHSESSPVFKIALKPHLFRSVY